MKYALYAILSLTTAILALDWHMYYAAEQGEQLVTWEMNR